MRSESWPRHRFAHQCANIALRNRVNQLQRSVVHLEMMVVRLEMMVNQLQRRVVPLLGPGSTASASYLARK